MQAEFFWVEGVPVGRLAVLPRPRGGDWLEDEVWSLRSSGVDVLVSLLTRDEVAELYLRDEPGCCAACGIAFISFPFADRGVPASDSDALALVRKLAALLADGKAIAIQWRQGVGRLASLGLKPESAFERIAKGRGRPVPDSPEQRDWGATVRGKWVVRKRRRGSPLSGTQASLQQADTHVQFYRLILLARYNRHDRKPLPRPRWSMSTNIPVERSQTSSEHPGPWTPGMHKLAGVGVHTNTILTRLIESEAAFRRLDKLGDESLLALASELSLSWSDEHAAEFLDKLDKTLQASGAEVVGADLCRWVRAHTNDPDAVVECASLVPPDDVTVLSRLSKRGSQKRVFLANWKKGSREVVLKQLLGSLADQELILGRELQSHPLAMKHPNVIATLPLTNSKGDKFLVEEKLPWPLKDEWRANGVQEASNLLSDIAHALAYLHEELKLVHGDVKPDNIGWKDGAYILLDFGICRRACEFSRDSTATGSLRTRAPELFLTDKYEEPDKADVWSLGATVFNAVTGRFPFIDQGESPPRVSEPRDRAVFEEIVTKRIQEEWQSRITLPEIPQPLRGVLARVLTRDPRERISAKELVRLCGHKLAGFLRTSGKAGPTAEAELDQILRHLPVESIQSMPTSRKQQLAERLKSFKHGLHLKVGQGHRIDQFLALLE
jgi:serine/threonine protein kinase